jgi:amino acid transporter
MRFLNFNFDLTPFYKFILIISVVLIVFFIIINVVLKSKSIGSFQKFILLIAIIILLVNLVIIALALYNSKNKNWPPMVPNCPDYWVSEGSGNKVTCINEKDLGVCQPQTGDKHLIMDFNKSPFIGAGGNCAKYTWANNCKVAWDGLTYGVNNPCK